ncbi:hypothetical protein [Frankia sp. CiP3]|uniref:hypothetical protein n=1 Tax=Frankia sp. CiP3 TaxID=2880971 RepID=UPI001EF67B60|nr:hypothetical protein [Frankia sp. CiP3]
MATCSRCNGRGMTGRGTNRGPCQACNATALGDRIVGAGLRLQDRLTGTTTTTTKRRKPAKKKTAPKRATAVSLPACDACGATGPLAVTSRGAVCLRGCPTPAITGGFTAEGLDL